MQDKFAAWTDSRGEPERAYTRDEMLDDISFYRLTNSAISAAWIYRERHKNNFDAEEQKDSEIKFPLGFTVFLDEIYPIPRS